MVVMSVIPALRRLRQEDQEFEARLIKKKKKRPQLEQGICGLGIGPMWSVTGVV
jgi:hypothetical protein